MSHDEEKYVMNIAIAGQAKSLFVESIDDAENGYFELANKKYNDALQLLEEMKYNSFIKKENITKNAMLYLHMQNHIAATEIIQLLALKLIKLYEKG